MLIDTHLHIIDRSRLSYPWLADAPPLDRDFLYGDYERQALQAGISGALHMEVDVAPEDIAAEVDFVRSISRRTGNLVRGAIVACRPEHAGFAELLESRIGDPFVKGFRRLLNPLPEGVCESRVFVENISRLAGTQLTFDAHVHAHQMPRAIALADAAPEVSFILDHCGVPDIRGGAYSSWRGGIAEIARRENVTAKISGIVAYADGDTWTVETLRPYVEHVIESFSWDRIVWGSDWPVCTLGGGLLAWVAATHALLSGCGDDEREKLFWRNADRIWRLGLANARAAEGDDCREGCDQPAGG
ncbi:MAG: amidohydrolase [Pseudaminobacter sp.]|nr:amidohydrolase [Pseudaminobacter sp.]